MLRFFTPSIFTMAAAISERMEPAKVVNRIILTTNSMGVGNIPISMARFSDATTSVSRISGREL